MFISREQVKDTLQALEDTGYDNNVRNPERLAGIRRVVGSLRSLFIVTDLSGGALPPHKSHKILKLTNLRDGGKNIYPAEKGIDKFSVSKAYVKKHDPQPGGYYVIYEDGYESWSPEEAFENGYSPIE